METYSVNFNKATAHAMLYEVGANFNLDADTLAGLIDTPARRKKVGYVNDPLDKGGETKFGVAKNANPSVNIKTLTWQQAKEIYYTKYWLAGGCHLLADKLALVHYDGCINHGVGRSVKFLQEILGATQDGQLGPKTAALANAQNQTDLINKLCDRRVKFYQQIVSNNPVQVRFLKGWLRRVNEVRDFSLAS